MLVVSTHTSHVESIFVTKKRSDSGDEQAICEPRGKPPIYQHMLSLEKGYSSTNNLDGHTAMKVWGLARWKNFVATCVTLHRTNEVEIRNAANENSTIVFAVDGWDVPEPSRFPWQAPPEISKLATRQMLLGFVLDEAIQSNSNLNGISCRIIYNAICASMLLVDDLRHSRLRAARKVLPRLMPYANLQLEDDMLEHFENLKQDMNHDLMAAARTFTKIRAQALRQSPGVPLSLVEDCPFCRDKAIGWSSFSHATCPSGHPFSKFSYLALVRLHDLRCSFRSMWHYLPANSRA